MRRIGFVLLIALAAGVLGAPAIERPRFIEVGERTRAPIGWEDFCKARPNECTREGYFIDVPRLEFNGLLLENLQQVNAFVNQRIAPVSDEENYGIPEHWTYPMQGRGDCEDVVLLKRHLLFSLFRIPLEVLLITVVSDHKGEGHAVLTVVTTAGEYILDSIEPRILLWADTAYRYSLRQSQSHPNVWVALRDPRQLRLTVSTR